MQDEKIGLGYIVKNDAEWLGRTLLMMRRKFNKCIVLDHCSTDGIVKVCKDNNVELYSKSWTDDFSAARNTLLSIAESRGLDWLLMLDADEILLDIEPIDQKYTAIAFPRYNMCSIDNYRPDLYPDKQCRMFKLNMNYRFVNKVHECLTLNGISIWQSETLKHSVIHIFHYCFCASKEKLWLKHHNYSLLTNNKPTLPKVPDGLVIPDLSVGVPLTVTKPCFTLPSSK